MNHLENYFFTSALREKMHSFFFHYASLNIMAHVKNITGSDVNKCLL
jgi:hypothetical protein